VACNTLRIMFVGKGKRVLGIFFGFFEILLWLIVASTVLSDLYSDPIKAAVYCIAFCCGILFGMELEQRMAVGLTSIQVVSLAAEAEKIGLSLRENGFGVTLLSGHSVDGTEREMLFVQLRRRRIAEAVRIVRGIDPEAIISASEVRSLGGGYMK